MGDGARQRHVTADAGQLDEHGQIDTCQHLDLHIIHDRNGKIGWRAAKHVRQHDNAISDIDLAGSGDNIGAALLHVIIGADGDGEKLVLWTDHMFERGLELDT
jgi:hypothetical protein